MRDTIATQAEQIRALKAQIDTQAEMITARNVKILKLTRERDALQAHLDGLVSHHARRVELRPQPRLDRVFGASQKEGQDV